MKTTFCYELENGEVLKLHKEIDKNMPSFDLIKSIPRCFEEALKEKGYTDEEIQETDYIFSMVKGWC